MRPASAESVRTGKKSATPLGDPVPAVRTASSEMATQVSPSIRWWLAPWGVIAGVSAIVATVGVVGGDCYWLVGLGRWIIAHGRIPDGVPFVAAPTSGWPNTLVLAELLFTAFASVGPQGLLAAQVAADVGALALLAAGARRQGTRAGGTSVVLALVFIGSLGALVVIRLQLLSLIPFTVLLLLLRAEYGRPSWRIWLLIPLCAMWSNLHGAVLMGLAVAGCYLLLSRLRLEPVRTVTVGMLSVAALFLTPALWRTGHYYYGVFNNEAAKRGTELWAAPSLSNAPDLLMICAGLVLLVPFFRRRRPIWEYVALAGLVSATVTSARHGLWLLFFLAAPSPLSARASRHVGVPTSARGPLSEEHVQSGTNLDALWLALQLSVVAVGLALVPISLRSPSSVTGSPPDLIRAVKSTAQGRVVIAEEPLTEELAASGVRVWASDPIDALHRTDQQRFLDFLAEPTRAQLVGLTGTAVVVLDTKHSLTVRHTKDLQLVRKHHGWSIYVVRADRL